jgi:putative Holliday junction resolvase
MTRIMGIDYGRRRIGLAISDPDGILALPHGVLEVGNAGEALKRVAARCREEAVTSVVVGLPLNMDGSSGPMAEEVRRFAEGLARRCGVPVEVWDERLSTWSADQMMIEADVRPRRRKAVRDKLAAQQILQSYLDAHAPPASP